MNKPNTNIFVPTIVDMSLLCKAKSVDGEWVVGYITPEHSPQTDKVWYKIRYQNKKDNNEYTTVQTVFVDEDTICRCLGFKDINGNYVFENHYVKHYNSQNGKDDKTSFELGKIFFDKASLSWKRTVEYIQENGQEVVVSRTLVKSEPATVQMSPHNDYELLGYAPNHSIIEYVQNR